MSLEQLLAWIPPGSSGRDAGAPGQLRAAAGARRHHHGRQRPLGGAAPPAARRRASRRHRRRSATPSRPSARLGLEVLTLYAFSVENWKRPRDRSRHADAAAEALPPARARHAAAEQHPLPGHRPDRRARARRPGRARTRRSSATAANTRHAVQHRAQLRRPRRDRRCRAPRDRSRACARTISTSSASPSFLYTAGQPDPDLLIRTSGEMRVSNFLLWQIAYAEIWVTDTLWPDFRRRHLLEAVARLSEARAPLRRHQPSPAVIGAK